ncbi:MAG: polysaccharide lyase family 1 protein [Mangrovibacterium sp.]
MNFFKMISVILMFFIFPECGLISAPDPAKEKTFETIRNSALLLSPDHEHYDSFSDDEFKIIKVTNLDKDGLGSLRWAIAQAGPRIVVFEIGGVIDLQQSNLNIREPYLFIAGQTAPSPGITIIRGGISISSHDVIMQHISIRPGDCNLAPKSGWEADGLSTNNGYNIVIDHCSFTWATDENLSASGPRHDGAGKTSRFVTFSNCIIAEGLYQSTHSKGIHSMGTLIHDYCRNIAIVGNLYAHNNQRNPMLKPNSIAFIANNLIYNPKSRAIHGSWPVDEYVDHPDSLRNAKATIIGNVMIAGNDTRPDLYMISGRLSAYLSDNIVADQISNAPQKIVTNEVDLLKEKPISTNKFALKSSAEVVSGILKNAGSRPADRNSIDKRIIEDLRNKRGKVINSQEEVGGYPSGTPVKRELQIPAKGIEKWLQKLSEELIPI